MDDNLILWLNEAYRLSSTLLDTGYGENKQGLESTGEQKILVVGQCVFSLSAESSMKDVLDEINYHYKKKIAADKLNAIMEIYLVHSVSQLCVHRALFLQGIMSMKADIQEYLMQVIIKHPHSEMRSRSGSKGSSMDTLDICKQCTIKEFTIRRLRQEITSMAEKALPESLSPQNSPRKSSSRREIKRLTEENHILTNKVVEYELAFYEKEKLSKDRDIRLTEFERLVKEYEVNMNKLNDSYKVQQEELEVLKPAATKSGSSQAALDKLHEKLEELNQVKQQLKTETKAHTETLAKLASIEKEVEPLRKLTSLVSEYRAKLAEVMIDLESATASLQSRDEEIKSLKNELELTMQAENQHFEQIKSLENELKSAQLQIRSAEYALGANSKDANPLLARELNQLRAENKDLSERLMKFPIDAIEKLEKEIEDQKYKSNALQTKWMTSKEGLEKSESVNRLLESRLEDQRREIEQLQTQSNKSQNSAAAGSIPIGQVDKPKKKSIFSFKRITSSKGLSLSSTSPKNETSRASISGPVELPTSSEEERFIPRVEHEFQIKQLYLNLESTLVALEDARKRVGELTIENESHARQMLMKKHECEVAVQAVKVELEESQRFATDLSIELEKLRLEVAKRQRDMPENTSSVNNSTNVDSNTQLLIQKLKAEHKIEMDRLRTDGINKEERRIAAEKNLISLKERNHLLFEENRKSLQEINALQEQLKGLNTLQSDLDGWKSKYEGALYNQEQLQVQLFQKDHELKRLKEEISNLNMQLAEMQILKQRVAEFNQLKQMPDAHSSRSSRSNSFVPHPITIPLSAQMMPTAVPIAVALSVTPTSSNESLSSNKPPPVVEQRVIAPKKDPDQEALDMALLLSQQESEYGVNMYDSLTPSDEPVIEQYMTQGFTREEAILIIFEDHYGKVTTQLKNLTPALPNLHRTSSTKRPSDPNMASDAASVMSAKSTKSNMSRHLSFIPSNAPTQETARQMLNNNSASPTSSTQNIQLTPEEEREVQLLISRGYNRETAVAIYMVYARKMANGDNNSISGASISSRKDLNVPMHQSQQMRSDSSVGSYSSLASSNRNNLYQHHHYVPQSPITANQKFVPSIQRVPSSNISVNTYDKHNRRSSTGGLPHQQNGGHHHSNAPPNFSSNSSVGGGSVTSYSIQVNTSTPHHVPVTKTLIRVDSAVGGQAPDPNYPNAQQQQQFHMMPNPSSQTHYNNNAMPNTPSGHYQSMPNMSSGQFQQQHPQQTKSSNSFYTPGSQPPQTQLPGSNPPASPYVPSQANPMMEKKLKRVDSFGSTNSGVQSVHSMSGQSATMYSTGMSKGGDRRSSTTGRLFGPDMTQKLLDYTISDESKIQLIMSRGYSREKASQIYYRRAF